MRAALNAEASGVCEIQPINMLYRYVTPIKRGRWKTTRRAALEAAVAAGCAHMDEWGTIYRDIFTEIETKSD